MKISELIKILQDSPDKNKEIYVESLQNNYTTCLSFDFDDDNNLLLYEVPTNYFGNLARNGANEILNSTKIEI